MDQVLYRGAPQRQRRSIEQYYNSPNFAQLHSSNGRNNTKRPRALLAEKKLASFHCLIIYKIQIGLVGYHIAFDSTDQYATITSRESFLFYLQETIGL